MKRAQLSREIEAFESRGVFEPLHHSGLKVGESQEVDRVQPTGSITDAAMILLERNGLFAPDQGLGKLQRWLGIEGQFTNYTALGNTLFVEAIDGKGMARKMVIPIGRYAESRRRQGNGTTDQSLGGRFTTRLRALPAMMRNLWNRPADSQSGSNGDGLLIATYPTIEIGAVCNGSRDYRSVASLRIKRDGPLPALLKRAIANQVSLELTRKDIESPIQAKKGGKSIGVCTASINDRDRWERHLAILLESTLRPDEGFLHSLS